MKKSGTWHRNTMGFPAAKGAYTGEGEHRVRSAGCLTSPRHSQAAPTPPTAPHPAPAVSAAAPPSVSGAGERRGEKYTRGCSKPTPELS